MGKYVARVEKDGLTLVLYRGEDMVLLAFDVAAQLRRPDFLGFGIQYRIGNDPALRDVYNFLTFEQLRKAIEPEETKAAKKAATDEQKKEVAKKRAEIMKTVRSPIQSFRWAHVPSVPIDGEVTYRVSAMFGDGEKEPVAKAVVEATLDVGSKTRGDFLNVGFTRGFASSQAYARRFANQTDIIPRKGEDEIKFDTSRFDGKDDKGNPRPYPWLGFEARKIMFAFYDECIANPDVLVDVFAYDLSDPEVVERLEAFKKRLRIVIDDSGTHGKKGSDENAAEKRLKQSAGDDNVVRHHFSGLQHNKVIIAKRKSAGGEPFAVLTGSTNFSLGGLYLQNNNALLFRSADVAKLYASVFAEAFPSNKGFSGKKIASDWFEMDVPDAGSYAFCFSPHKKSSVSLTRLADSIKGAKKSVFYAIAFYGSMKGLVGSALRDLKPDDLLVMGVANMPGKPKSKTVMVQQAGRGPVPIGPAALEKDLPQPFLKEWKGGGGIRMHHKFVVCDFNGDHPVVYTGSSNLADAEGANGDNLIEIKDPKVVVAYAVQAISIFDHYGFRNRMKKAKKNPAAFDLSKPPAAGKEAWWANAFRKGEPAQRDRELFAGQAKA
jgi:phosphatidylserine/phosphatidylglycerophosphate/cardiolipin synthase-like enzyme